MAGVDIERGLQDHRRATAAARASEAARNERYREIRDRAKNAGKLAIDLTDITGFSIDTGLRGSIFSSRISAPIPLGKIESEPGKYGFAKINVYYGLDHVERVVKGRIFSRTIVDKVPNDTLQELTIGYFAGNEDGTGLENFAHYHWSIPGVNDENAVAGVEEGLQQLCEVLGYNPDTSTE